MSDRPERDKLTPHAKPTSLPVGSCFEDLANQPLNSQLVEKIGAIRKMRRWLTRDLTSFTVGVSASILMASLPAAPALWQGKPFRLDDKLIIYGIAACIVGVFTGFCLMLACFVVEHMKSLRRWRFAYGVVLLLWAALWLLMWAEACKDREEEGLPPPDPTFVLGMGFMMLPVASFLSLGPLTAVGVGTSFTRRAKRPDRDSLLARTDHQCLDEIADTHVIRASGDAIKREERK
jgi:hypothetical protein